MDCEITIGNNETKRIKELLQRKNIFVVTDVNVERLYGDLLDCKNKYVLPCGEQTKTLTQAENVMRTMLEKGCDKTTELYAVGGGVVGDVCGFIASIFMRGISWINIPTTLLSQVDSSIGGKTAVNLDGYKNMIGSFHLPKQVIISMHFLDTLDNREWKCGLGEIIKTSFLSDKVRKLFDKYKHEFFGFEGQNIQAIIRECVHYKRQIIEQDFFDKGERKKLNVGHTIGHAIEKLSAGKLSHGECVVLGLEAESYVLGNKLSKESRERIQEIVTTFSPTYPKICVQEIVDATLSDKKNANGKITIIVPSSTRFEEIQYDKEEIERGLNEWKSHREKQSN